VPGLAHGARRVMVTPPAAVGGRRRAGTMRC
jgi:hypothetical protein